MPQKHPCQAVRFDLVQTQCTGTLRFILLFQLYPEQEELLYCFQQRPALGPAGNFQQPDFFTVQFPMQFHAIANGRTILVLYRTQNRKHGIGTLLLYAERRVHRLCQTGKHLPHLLLRCGTADMLRQNLIDQIGTAGALLCRKAIHCRNHIVHQDQAVCTSFHLLTSGFFLQSYYSTKK